MADCQKCPKPSNLPQCHECGGSGNVSAAAGEQKPCPMCHETGLDIHPRQSSGLQADSTLTFLRSVR
jgi:hypothetical protein